MSVQAYDRYRDSGVAWLGEVPVDWDLKRLAHFFAERRDKCSDVDFRALSVTKSGIVPQLETAAKTDDGDNRRKVVAGDFVINSRSDRKGSSGLSALDGSVSLINTVLAPLSGIHGRFAHHLFRSIAFQEEYYRYGKGIVADLWSTNFSEMRNITLAVPSMAEQNAIATFLDRETAKIDELVEEQRRLIDLLNEKRQAVISHAVTKGLDPSVAMKDSGVEWLGEVPAHWEVSRVKYASTHVVDCLHTTPTYDGELLFPAVRTADIERGRLLLENARLVSREIYEDRVQRLVPQADDILYTREGERFGLAAIVPPGVDLCLGQRMMMLRIDQAFEPAFVMWVLNSDSVYQQVVAGITGATAPHVNISEVINFHLPVPAIAEQKAIALHIQQSTNLLDQLMAEALAGIDLLRERRSALISAAVTGKIDVRSLNAGGVRKIAFAEIIYLNARSRTFGRVKNQKLLYLAEVHAGIHEIGGKYTRDAAGPYDGDLIRTVEHELVVDGVLTVSQPDGPGSAVKYSVPRSWKPDREESQRMLGGRLVVLDHIINKLADLDTRGAEAVATLYAVWNDVLLDGEIFDEERIIRGFLDEWHPEKRLKFNVGDLRTWLGWMRRHGLVPEGRGPKTTTGRLFI